MFPFPQTIWICPVQTAHQVKHYPCIRAYMRMPRKGCADVFRPHLARICLRNDWLFANCTNHEQTSNMLHLPVSTYIAITWSNNYRTNYSAISATETKIDSPLENFCRQHVIDMRRYRNKLTNLTRLSLIKDTIRKSHIWRFISYILILIKQYRVKQLVYFHTYRLMQKRYRIYAGEYLWWLVIFRRS